MLLLIFISILILTAYLGANIVISLFSTAVVFGGHYLCPRPTNQHFEDDEKASCSEFKNTRHFIIDGLNILYKFRDHVNPNLQMNFINIQNLLDDLLNVITNVFNATYNQLPYIHFVIKNLNSAFPPSMRKEYFYQNIDRINPDFNYDKLYKWITGYLSKKYLNVSFHYAFGMNEATGDINHHMDGRDDLLSIILKKKIFDVTQEPIILLTQDNYADYRKYKEIKPFIHYDILGGQLIQRSIIYPQNYAIDPLHYGLGFKRQAHKRLEHVRCSTHEYFYIHC